MLLIEIITFTSSCLVLRVQHPPAIRLLNTNTHKVPSSRSATPNPSTRAATPSFLSNKEPDLLASLSLSGKPVITSSNPVFGLPSLLSSSNVVTPVQHGDNEDGMDWTPTNTDAAPSPKRGVGWNTEDSTSWLRPQQFFAPEKPTGLEGLFERTKLEDEAMRVDVSEQQSIRRHVGSYTWYLGCVILLVVPFVGLAYKLSLGVTTESTVPV